MTTSSLPETVFRIIQGGMGIAVSNWRLARAVAKLGEMGVVSGTAIDSVMVRELQLGDPHGRLSVLKDYPDQGIVDYLKNKFFVPEGRKPEEKFQLLPLHGFNPTLLSQRILSAATFSEVRLAKWGHDGLVGINLLTKLKRFTLPCMIGAIAAGANAVLMGAGIPLEEIQALPELAAGQPAKLRLDVDMSGAPDGQGPYYYELDPAQVLPELGAVDAPAFFPIISSDVLARMMSRKLPEGAIGAWIIEGFTAGGHNAPPRGKQIDTENNPVYDHRDIPILEKVQEIGIPFYLAGGYGTPAGLEQALEMGASGVQVGSLFSLAEESGYPAELKTHLIAEIHKGALTVRTDGMISPTGFPFKVLELPETISRPEVYEERTRICDLGYLQTPFADAKGRLKGRCPAEPVDTYIKKGGKEEDTVRRACLCNGLMANIGLGQRQDWGEEGRLFTAGDEVVNLKLGSVDSPRFSAADVIDYLYGRPAGTSS